MSLLVGDVVSVPDAIPPKGGTSVPEIAHGVVTSASPQKGRKLIQVPPPVATLPQKGRKYSKEQFVDETDFQVASESCRTCGCSGIFCVNCGKPNEKIRNLPAGCPTCGAVNFCMYCGHPTGK